MTSGPGRKLRIRTLVAICVWSASGGTAIVLAFEGSWDFGLLATEVGLVSVMLASGVLLGKWLKEDEKPPFPMCLNCGYDLRGIKGSVCPECGKPTGREA